MANYDSDSSEEGRDYTTTNVILGYASTDSAGDEISHIGGHPIWLDENKRPALSFSKCKNCNGYLSLLLQLNADLQQHFPHDTRRIYVLACRNRTCSRKTGSIRAFREVKKPQTKRAVPPSSKNADTKPQQVSSVGGLGNLLFGGNGMSTNTNANPFSTSSSGATTTLNPFSKSTINTAPTASSQRDKDIQPPTETFAEKLKIHPTEENTTDKPQTAVETWPEQSVFPKAYPHAYLDAYPEELDPTPPAPAAEASTSIIQYDTEDVGVGGMERDTFESSLDKTFQKFSDLVAQNPEQVLRYEFRGQPLLYSGVDGVSARFVMPHGNAGAVKGIPRCESCGGQRVFELQLMPYLIFEIEKDETVGINEGMEWGTVIVGTCGRNCGVDGAVDFREEWVGPQWEERVAKS